MDVVLVTMGKIHPLSLSSTKYLGGHTDIVGGALSCASATVLSKLVLSRLQVGACMVGCLSIC